MDSIERGKQKMREYFAEQRARHRRPVKVNLPNHQDNKQEDVSSPPNVNQRPITVQQPTPININQLKSQFNLTGLGLTISLIGAVGGYIYLTTPSIKAQIDYLIAQGIGKLSILRSSNIIMGIIFLGIGLALIGLITKKK